MSAPPDPDQFPRRSSPWWLLRLLGVAALVGLALLFTINLGSQLGQDVAERLDSAEASSGPTLVPDLSVEVEIPFGSSATRVAEILQEQGVIAESALLLAAVQDAGVASAIQAGTYQLTTGTPIDELLVELLAGPVSTSYRLTVFAGLRLDEILDLLAEASLLAKSEFEAALLGGAVSSEFVDESQPVSLKSWEGLLFPDTYEFDNDAGAAEILQRLADTMEQRMSLVDWNGIGSRGFTPYQGIIIASIIESEVRLAEERPLVASVVFNRKWTALSCMPWVPETSPNSTPITTLPTTPTSRQGSHPHPLPHRAFPRSRQPRSRRCPNSGSSCSVPRTVVTPSRLPSRNIRRRWRDPGPRASCLDGAVSTRSAHRRLPLGGAGRPGGTFALSAYA